MNADEAWEQFKKAVNDQRALQKTSATEKLDVIAAQNIQNSLMMEELQEKIEELTAPTAPGANPDIMAGAGGMPPDMMGMSPEMMAQMAGGAPPGAPPGGVPPMAGTAEPSQSFALSAKKKRLISKNKVLKAEDVEKSALNSEDEHKTVGDGDNPIEAHYNQLINALGEAIKTTTDKTTAIKLSVAQSKLISLSKTTPIQKKIKGKKVGGSIEEFKPTKLGQVWDDKANNNKGGYISYGSDLEYDIPKIQATITDDEGNTTQVMKPIDDREALERYNKVYRTKRQEFRNNAKEQTNQFIIPFLMDRAPEFVDEFNKGRNAYFKWVQEHPIDLEDDSSMPETAISNDDAISLSRLFEKYATRAHKLNGSVTQSTPLTKDDIYNLLELYKSKDVPNEYLVQLFKGALNSSGPKISTSDLIRAAYDFYDSYSGTNTFGSDVPTSLVARTKKFNKLVDLLHNGGDGLVYKEDDGRPRRIDLMEWINGAPDDKRDDYISTIFGLVSPNIVPKVDKSLKGENLKKDEDRYNSNIKDIEKVRSMGLGNLLSRLTELDDKAITGEMSDDEEVEHLDLTSLLSNLEEWVTPEYESATSMKREARDYVTELMDYIDQHSMTESDKSKFAVNAKEINDIFAELFNTKDEEGNVTKRTFQDILNQAKASTKKTKEMDKKRAETKKKIEAGDYEGLTYEDFGLNLKRPSKQIWEQLPEDLRRQAAKDYKERVKNKLRDASSRDEYLGRSRKIEDNLVDEVLEGYRVFGGDKPPSIRPKKRKVAGIGNNIPSRRFFSEAHPEEANNTPYALASLQDILEQYDKNYDMLDTNYHPNYDNILKNLSDDEIVEVLSKYYDDLGMDHVSDKGQNYFELPKFDYDDDEYESYDTARAKYDRDLDYRRRVNRERMTDEYFRANEVKNAIGAPAHSNTNDFNAKAHELAEGRGLDDNLKAWLTDNMDEDELADFEGYDDDQFRKALEIALRDITPRQNWSDELTYLQALPKARDILQGAYYDSLNGEYKDKYVGTGKDAMNQILDSRLGGVVTAGDTKNLIHDFKEIVPESEKRINADYNQLRTGVNEDASAETEDAAPQIGEDAVRRFLEFVDAYPNQITDQDRQSLAFIAQKYEGTPIGIEATRLLNTPINKSIRSMISCRGRGNGVFKY